MKFGYGDARAFEPWTHGALSLRNRIAMAPMTRRQAAEDGIATEAIAAYYRRRAENEVGLIISEGTGIDGVHAYDTLTVPRFETAGQHAAWRRVVDAVHDAGGAFAPQLWHCGRLAANPIGPSATAPPPRADGTPRPTPRSMETADFSQVLDAYRSSAAAARAIGCDALEIHGAHGYLLDSFLSAASNVRDDAYGGTFDRRMRFPLEVVRAVRAEVGPGFPILYRFSQWKVDDYREMKFHDPEELGTWVRALREAGADILHVSTRGATDAAFDTTVDPSGRSLAGWTRDLSGLPVIAVGKVSVTLGMDESRDGRTAVVEDPGPALALLETGEADLLAVGRALLANPDWVRVVRDGDWRTLQPYHADVLNTLV